MGGNVEVTQADREAARKLYGSADWSQERIATHFARYRLAHQTPPATQPSAAVIEAIEQRREIYEEKMARVSHRAEDMFNQRDLFQHAVEAFDELLDEIATLHTPPPVATATVVDALARCEGLESGPNGRGGMRVVVHFPNGGDETALFSLLNSALATPTPQAGDQ